LTFDGDGSAAIVPGEFQPNRFTIAVTTSDPGTLVYQDAYHPSWKVYIDGVAHLILPTPFGFKSVALPEGRHYVVWRFEPLINGIVLSVVGITLASVAPLLLL